MHEIGHLDNNKIIFVNAIIVSSVVFVMALVLIVMLIRRKRAESTRKSTRPKNPKRKNRYSSSNIMMVDDESSTSERRTESYVENNKTKQGAKKHGSTGSEIGLAEVEDLPSSYDSAAMMGSSSLSGQYHFSFRDLEFSEMSDEQQRCYDDENNLNLKDIDSVSVVRERKLTEITEESSDSDYDATFETTVEEP